MLKKIKIDYYLLVLVLVSLFLCYKNYTPNTFLSGWDTLHPEFNLSQYWGRITTMWQSHQGLGAPPSQAHASEIPRMALVALFTTLFPLSFVRYAYMFLMILIGPIGVYLFLKYLLSRQPGHHLKIGGAIVSVSSLLGALFYLLNIGTVQHFIAPLEMFTTKFGYIGFLFLFSTQFIHEGRKKHLLYFGIASILSSAMAHTATLWYVYFIGLVSYLFFLSLFKHSYIKRSLIIVCLSLVLNLFWILPNMYYSSNYYSDVINSKIHRLSSEETYYYNKKYGDVKDYLLLRNFLFDWKVIDNSQRSVPLLGAWENHLQSPFVSSLGVIFFCLSCGGILVSIKKKKVELISLVPLFVGVSFFLLSDIPALFTLFSWLRDRSPLIKEVLRSPFTKFSLYLIFLLATFFGYFHYYLLTLITHIFKRVRSFFFIHGYLYVCVLVIFFYILPAFQGNFISPVERVRIPQEYFDLFDWSRQQDSERMLILPINNMFGWVYYKWEYPDMTQTYQGAGFTWFGLKQPTLNREFDRWYPNNEQSYRELSYAVYSKNVLLFQNLLEKYKIKYILLDKNVFIPDDNNYSKALFFPQLLKMITSNKNIKLVKTFGSNISVFQYDITRGESVSVANNIEPSYRSSYIDQGYIDKGEYITQSYSNTSLIYPGRNILNEKERVNNSLLKINDDSYSVNFGNILHNGTVFIPPIEAVEKESYIDIYVSTINEKPRLRIQFLIPYLSGNDNTEQYVYLPSKKITSFIINSQQFVIPDGKIEGEVYLGEILIEFNRENAIYYSMDSIIEKMSVTLPSSKAGTAPQQDKMEIVGNFPSEQIHPDIGSLVSTINDCHSSKSEYINKEQITIGADEYALNYQARNGTICDTMSFPNLSHNQGYIVAIESQHVSGLPLKVCFEDYVLRKCFINDELSQFKGYDTDYFIIPPYNDSTNGYRLSVNNFGIGSLLTENNIKNIRIIPFPYNYFQSIYWSNESKNENHTIITNNEAFEKNWKAFQINAEGGNISWIQTHFPSLFGTELTSHVLVNNWANGWDITGIKLNDKAKIVILFWPQYLEYIGFVMIVLCLSIVILWPIPIHTNPPTTLHKE
ncbi:MAG: hypothetical protein V1922_05940 [bacterium]